MKIRFLSVLLFVFLLCSCQTEYVQENDELSLQKINEMFECRMESYNNRCVELSLDPFCKDALSSAKNQVEYFYRTVQFTMFDIVMENRFSESGIYNYDVYFYKDGTAEMIYRHAIFGEESYIIDVEERFELSNSEIITLKDALSKNDFESLPTWNPQEPDGLDGETTYIYGTGGLWGHLATRWCAPEDDGVYKIRTAIEQVAGAHAILQPEKEGVKYVREL